MQINSDLNKNALNANDVASLLNISAKTVYKLAKDGLLKSYRVGRKLFFTTDAVEDYINGCTRISKCSTNLAGEKNAASNLDNLHTGEALAVDETQLLSTLNAFRADGLFVIAGNDVIAAMLAQRLCEQGLQSVSFGMSGYVGLVELYVGGVQAAITHLFDQKTSSYNIAYLRRLAPGMPVRLIHLYRRQIGICVRRGNPKNITSIVRAVRLGAAFANVAKPASARIFLDEQLLDADVKPASVVGYDTAYGSEFLAASAVASREADVCVASVEAARKVGGVEFVPVAIEQVDLAVVKSAFTETYLDAIKQLLSDDSFIRGAEHMVVGDISKMGYVLYDV